MLESIEETCGEYTCKNARKLFESFSGPSDMSKDVYSNYINNSVHSIYVGFKNWYKTNICKNCKIGE